MLYTPLYLRRTPGVVGAVMSRLTLVAHQFGTTFRAMRDEMHGLCAGRTLIRSHTDNLRNYLTALFHIDEIAYVQVETLYEVFVVERSPLHQSACQLHGFHICHGRDGTRAPHLVGHLAEACACPFGLELVGDGPSRTLRRIAQTALLAQGVHFKHNAVGGNGKVLALRVPIVYVVENFLKGLHLLHSLAYLESPSGCCLQVFVVAFRRKFLSKQIIQIAVEMPARHKA